MALYELWKGWGIEPSLVMGHSVGEYAAACAAGVFSLEEGLKLVAERGRLMGGISVAGSMAAVLAEEALVREAIRPFGRVSVSAVNGPESVVISGPLAEIDAALNDLARYSSEKPDLIAIFKKHGLELKLPASQETQSPPLEP